MRGPGATSLGRLSMRRRVVITGMGAITPVAHHVAGLYRSLCEGQSGVATIEHFNAHGFPTSFAAEVKNFTLGQFVSNSQDFSNAGPNTQFALAAARQALADAIPLIMARAELRELRTYLAAHLREAGHAAVAYTGQTDPDERRQAARWPERIAPSM